MTHYKLTPNDVGDIITSFIEGGYSSWCRSALPVGDPLTSEVEGLDVFPFEDHAEAMKCGSYRLAVHLFNGGKVEVVEDMCVLDQGDGAEPMKGTFNLAKIKASIRKRASIVDSTVEDFVGGEADAIDADAVVQMAAFGEVVFG